MWSRRTPNSPRYKYKLRSRQEIDACETTAPLVETSRMTDRRDRVAYVWDARRRDASPAKRAFVSECPQPNLASHRQGAAFGPLWSEADRSADD